MRGYLVVTETGAGRYVAESNHVGLRHIPAGNGDRFERQVRAACLSRDPGVYRAEDVRVGRYGVVLRATRERVDPATEAARLTTLAEAPSYNGLGRAPGVAGNQERYHAAASGAAARKRGSKLLAAYLTTLEAK